MRQQKNKKKGVGDGEEEKEELWFQGYPQEGLTRK